MNIAIGIERTAGCEYVRTVVPYLELKRRGHNVVFCDKITNETFNNGYPPGTPLAMGLDGKAYVVQLADVFVCQRLDGRGALDNLRHLQSRGCKIIYDLDDNFHAIPSSNPNAADHGPGSEKTAVQDDFVRMCDLFTVSTPALANEYARIRDGRPMAICPNAVDDKQFARFEREITGAAKRPGEIRIGWAGSGTHSGDFDTIMPALWQILDEFPQVQIVFIGADLRHMFPERHYRRDLAGGFIKRNIRNRVEFAGQAYSNTPFTISDLVRTDTTPLKYLDLIRDAELDIAIAPLASTVFNSSKSWVKALEYGMMGLPVLLSRFGPYLDFAVGDGSDVDDITNLILARERRDWLNGLRFLIRDEAARGVIGRTMRERVGRRHVISKGAEAWEAALRLIREPVSA